ncbi:MAG: hypothetical protein LBE91_17700 [Tannerella sp.]|jgi:hypothetical protein|nr:hypothetical protein [Tannerella sp.]
MAKEYSKQENESPSTVQEPAAIYQRSASQTGLNKAQLHFLQLLNYVRTDEELDDLNELVSNFLLKKIQKEANRLWDEGKIGDFLLNEHLRTPYKIILYFVEKK